MLRLNRGLIKDSSLASDRANSLTKKPIACHLKFMNWDRAGLILSGLCVVHCLAAPIFIFSLPALFEGLNHPLFHILVAILVVPVAFWSFRNGFRVHQQKWPAMAGGVGVAILICGAIFPHLLVHKIGHSLVTISGSVWLMVGHAANWHYRSLSHKHAPGEACGKCSAVEVAEMQNSLEVNSNPS